MRKRTKWLLLSLLILVIVLFALHRFYIYVLQDTWASENAVIEQAKQETDLVQGDKVWKSVWDDVCWVVQGKDGSGREMMVWLREGHEPVVRLLSEGVSETRVRTIINESLPGITIVRLVPGIYNERLVWQLFYKQKDHHYYRFYDFGTGEALNDVFTLPNR
ncbi:hypothetical protein HMSSN036_53060 [Paenibacillus macerans]|uniref:Cell wall elongation regulator TseB-like domain-containing protein n=1 Tax=Paenibacillus macerans TaxID=44252 RepID=A0A090ZZW4_PAEMA|nr:DUF5590 domain-containing protein [Paenibacillus macerans]KFN09586.1 hypothetical protein DJ90_3232 [Paenibacillus macerans]MBS5912302.1 DUF5590 domain-containing protein [Paenibacillus macerans]MCY7557877.1 DUF5590 domain-containing protein [Paenibacillus macerans]MDU7476016.1 DUF5590 domain-containing protein [Paenibacillus macerans]MEC0140155.1 DUF5590 domain-containing protein [Paenibacillus macerans]